MMCRPLSAGAVVVLWFQLLKLSRLKRSPAFLSNSALSKGFVEKVGGAHSGRLFSSQGG